MKVGDRVKLVRSEDEVYAKHIGLTGTIISVRPDEGNAALPITVKFDKLTSAGGDTFPQDSFYPEELVAI